MVSKWKKKCFLVYHTTFFILRHLVDLRLFHLLSFIIWILFIFLLIILLSSFTTLSAKTLEIGVFKNKCYKHLVASSGFIINRNIPLNIFFFIFLSLQNNFPFFTFGGNNSLRISFFFSFMCHRIIFPFKSKKRKPKKGERCERKGGKHFMFIFMSNACMFVCVYGLSSFFYSSQMLISSSSSLCR